MSLVVERPADLDPQLLQGRTYASRRSRFVIGVPSVLYGVIILLYALPATLIVPNLTYAGRPALLLCMGLLCWWLLSRFNPRLLPMGPQPMRWVMFGYFWATLLSYLAGVLRGLPSVEANGENFNMLVLLEFLGIMIMAADGIPNWRKLESVLKVLMWCAGFMALVGIIQALFKYDVAQFLVVPGLQLKADLVQFQSRGNDGLFRVAGTATHYIEYSTVLAMAVPFCVHFARFGRDKVTRRAGIVVGVLCLFGIPVAISRTGILALLAEILAMSLLAWNWRIRYNVLIIGVFGTAALGAVKPGLVGTIRSLFQSAGSDPSVTGRTQDYAYTSHFIDQRPWLGRGPGTFIPQYYTFLDNQWLLSLVSTGIVGVAALALFHITCTVLAYKSMRRATSDEVRHLCAALIATQFVAVLVGGTFDSLSFTTYSFTLALLSGMCGAVWRFTHPTRTVRTSSTRRVRAPLQVNMRPVRPAIEG